MKNLCRVLIFCCAVVATAAAHSASAENDAIAHYSNRAVELLRDAISRETAYGQGLVPAYAESLRQVFLDAGFPPEALTIVPYGETASLLMRYEGDGSSGRRPILFSSHMDVVPAALTGKDGGQLVGIADPMLIVPSNTTARIQEMHITLGQMLCDVLEQRCA